MRRKLLLISSALIIFLSSCKETFVASRGSADWDFLPLQTGIISMYEIEETTYLGRSIEPEVENYLLREEIVSEQTWEDGSTVYTILNSLMNDTGDWEPNFYWTIREEFDQGISNISNMETVELSFPLLNDKIWDARKNLDECPDTNGYCDYFQVKERDQEFEIKGITYPKTVRIVKQNDLDPLQIAQDFSEFSVYAQGTGLIYSERIEIEYASCRNNQNPDCCCPDNILCTVCAGEIEFGTVEKKTLLERIFPQ